MSAGRIVLSGYSPARDRNDALVPGAKLYVYVNGTTTPAAIYAEVGLSTPLANPVVANSSGQFVSIWADAGTEAVPVLYTLSITGPAGESIGNPSVFDDYRPSVDYVAADAAVAAAAAAAASANLTAADAIATAADRAATADKVSLTALAASTGAALVGWISSLTGAVARLLSSKLADFVTLKDFGAVGDGTTNDAAAINLALASGAKVIDGSGLTYKINSAVTVPAGVRFQNFTLQIGTAGINAILVNTGSHVFGKVIGSNTTSIIERAVYPAADGVTDVVLDMDISYVTVGVHAQYLTTDTDANTPKRWTGSARLSNIVGTTGASEGYGVILSPADQCDFQISAKTVARHAVYLSAGASQNRIVASVDGCSNYAVQLYSESTQGETSDNQIYVRSRNLAQTVATQSGPVAIIQKCNRNRVVIDDIGNNAAYSAALVEGSSGGPYPSDNQLVDCRISGQYTGPAVFNLLNQQRTVVKRNTLMAYSANYVIGFRRSGINGAEHGGYCDDNVIDAQAANIHGIYNECNAQPVYIGLNNDIRNFGLGTRVNDGSTGYQRGIAAAIPSGGQSYVGEITMKTAPASVSPPGWVCTAAGTPGTWTAMANLA